MTDKDFYQSEIFQNRISKKHRELRKWARKNGITCYRIYDRDIPEIPLCLDIYEFLPPDITSPLLCADFLAKQNERQSANDMEVFAEIAERRYAVLYLYERPYEKDEDEENEWLNLMSDKVTETFSLLPNHVVLKQRKHQKGLNQYEKSDAESTISGLVQEQGVIFKVDLTSYIDTGLFFDHRPLRGMIREISLNKSVLNLFCYTGSISVYAAVGGASRIESVDLSNTYLSWAKENFALNNFYCEATTQKTGKNDGKNIGKKGNTTKERDDNGKFVFTKDDVFHFLDEKLKSKKNEDRYDIIILDPPTFSNSKMSKTTLDINRQWPDLAAKCLNLLNPAGILYFSTNSKRLSFDASLLPETTITGFRIQANDITTKTIPKDFFGRKPHKTFEIEVGIN